MDVVTKSEVLGFFRIMLRILPPYVLTARTNVTGDLGIPEQQHYIEKVEELEAYQQQQQYKYVQEVPESTSPPVFKSPIKDQTNIREGGFAHFEARLEPIGDSTLQVEWLKDGHPVEASECTLLRFLSSVIEMLENMPN
jgi:hypothetical protein